MKKKLLVVMNHELTEEQKVGWDELVILSNVSKTSDIVKNISPIAKVEEIKELAMAIVLIALLHKCTHIAIMGEPTLVLHTAMIADEVDIKPVTATSERISVDEPQPDGSIKKISKFQHVMWRNLL